MPTRIAFRIPSLYFLLKSLVLLSIIILQVADLLPATNIDALRRLADWAGHKEMEDVCWSVFGSVCLALLVAALTRGLEGPYPGNQSSFNIFGYAMLLHIYSLPMTHTVRTKPSRPDINVLLTLFMPLLQVTLIHGLGVRRKWSRYRLVPTTICSVASLVHFNFVLVTNPSSYPLLNYLSSLLETTLVLVTLLTLILNAATQILLEGQITRPLFGHAASLAPRWDEDFSIVLLRLGTASLDATNVAGLGNEVGSIAAGRTQDIDTRHALAGDSVVELMTGGVKSLTLRGVRGGGDIPKGFHHEIKTVKVQTKDGDWIFDEAKARELGRFCRSMLDFCRGCFWLFMWAIWYKWRGVILPGSRDTATGGAAQRPPPPVPTESTHAVGHGDDDVYSRFIRGEVVSDDEDDYDPSLDVDEEDADVSEEDSESEESESNGKGLEAAGLYSDFLSEPASSTSANPGPVLLAHMTAQSALPLTRRRYGRLVFDPRSRSSPEHQHSGWTSFVNERRFQAETSAAGRGSGASLEGRMNCVICTSEPREIICWPCRCLALCNDCRENLASRFPPAKHTCPCCRRNVEGFSKIFIP